jgi:hypothetical protein
MRPLVPFLLLTLIFAGPGLLHVIAQDSEILSRKPPVYKTFERDKNETTVTAMLIDPGSLKSPFDPDNTTPDFRLNTAEYTYSGSHPSRPSTVALVFLAREKLKTEPKFSVVVDGSLVQEGETTLRQVCCVQFNGRDITPQHILVSVSLDAFERITQAKKTEIKLDTKRGKYSFKLNDFQKKSLAALKNTIK